MAEQLLKCPNCGANATNHENCEYCGSLLVRFVEKGIDLSKTSYMTSDGVFPGLVEELRQNFKLQEKHPMDFVCTDIVLEDKKNNTFYTLSVLRTGRTVWYDGKKFDSFGKTQGFIIGFKLRKDVDVDQKQHERFKELDCYPLFTYREVISDHLDEYMLDFGEDAEGAARLISDIIQKVYLVPLFENLEMHTGVGVVNVERMRKQYWEKRGFEYQMPDRYSDADTNSKPWWRWFVYLIVCLVVNQLIFNFGFWGSCISTIMIGAAGEYFWPKR